ncbi:uncharacterized protein UTRI_06224_B [Ustilago trichophora]|uniref:Effector family protein Eff1 n=1 Tax=Ustilago trichophora TaxID=86804 RepID=A0A5C3EK66_9BASI|nr:uncharacterized protein UTRI_06224_B [Ustilago trichophora]
MLFPVATFKSRTHVLVTFLTLLISVDAGWPEDHDLYFRQLASANDHGQLTPAIASAHLTDSRQEHLFHPPSLHQDVFWNNFAGTSNTRDEASPSQVPAEIPVQKQPSPLQPSPDLEEPFVKVPELSEMAIDELELYHLRRTLQNRLMRAGIPPLSLTTEDVLEDVRHIHLELLREQLQRQIDIKHFVFLGPSLEPNVRFYAIPILRDRVKETLIERAATGRVGWAFVAVNLGKNPQMKWIRYGLLDVTGRKMFVKNLAAISNAHKLDDVLKRIK